MAYKLPFFDNFFIFIECHGVSATVLDTEDTAGKKTEVFIFIVLVFRGRTHMIQIYNIVSGVISDHSIINIFLCIDFQILQIQFSA